MPLELLSPNIRKYIYDKRWPALHAIQRAAIQKIITTEENYILASRTASGKTEAAFLPILSKVNFNEQGVQVLYISPLIALINDQFIRVEELCKNLEVKVTKWHGEASKTLKEQLIKQPEGIVLITPESLEAMFVNAPYNVKALFSNLKYIVIDEIHSFIGTDRGTQLKSILSRIQQVNPKRIIKIGLSATIGDYVEGKKFTGEELRTKILLDTEAKEIHGLFKYFEGGESELPFELINDLYIETKDNKVLIFPNSRGKAEEIAVKLKKLAEKQNGHPYYFSHHSSIDKDLREYIEHFAKNNSLHNFCISCTSTLELGIDIGSVDEVVQIDATHSIASLIQRIGRSGRRNGEASNLILYATNPWSFLQSLACWVLFKEKFIEPVQSTEKPYDILLHQILSIVKELSGCPRPDLIGRVKKNHAFEKITEEEIEEILNKLIELDLLEFIQFELIIGIEGEKIVNSKDFYSVFKSEDNFKVINSGNKIGEIPYSPQIIENENLLLAARIWKIKDVDFKAKRIEVIPAKDGKKPLFFGGGGIIHPKIREKMLEIVYGKNDFSELDEKSIEILQALRKEFASFPIHNLNTQRPVIQKEDKIVLYTFTGTRINRSLNFLFKTKGINVSYDEHSSSFEIPVPPSALPKIISDIASTLEDIDFFIDNELRSNPALMDFSKWGRFLPGKYQMSLVKERYFDFWPFPDFLKTIG